MSYEEQLANAQAKAMKEVNKLRKHPGKLTAEAYLRWAEDIRDASVPNLEYMYRHFRELNEKAVMEKLAKDL